MLTTSLAGCTGDNNELNLANDRIDELEAQVASDDILYQKLMNDFTNQSILINELQNSVTGEEVDESGNQTPLSLNYNEQ